MWILSLSSYATLDKVAQPLRVVSVCLLKKIKEIISALSYLISRTKKIKEACEKAENSGETNREERGDQHQENNYG